MRWRIAVIGAALLLVPVGPPALAEDPAQAPRSEEELLRLGERMYREGILPSGEPMRAFVKGDIPVSGRAFSCESCHMRSGLGSFEGEVSTPPTNGSSLYQPRKKYYKGVEIKYNESAFNRPAYTDETLAIVIRSGTDPTGKVLNDVMPWYLLEAEDMAVLIRYLKSLSSQYSPGVTDTSLRFATVIGEDVDPAESAAMLEALERFVTYKNNFAKNYQRRTTARDRLMAVAMSTSREVEDRTLTLSRWVLTGPPETWRGQLEEHYRREPVFALLGGIVSGEWQPIHQFCEANGVPCVFPNTEFPVISSSDWYTLYLSKGYYQEGEAAARYLNGTEGAGSGRPPLQIVRDAPEGRALAAGFTATWRALGHATPPTLTLEAGKPLTRDFLRQVLDREQPAALLLWDGAGEVLPALESLATVGSKPAPVFVSARYLGEGLWTLPAPAREFTFATYPFRPPQDPVRSPMGGIVTFQVENTRIAQQTYALVQVLSMAVMGIKGNYYRDYFLDVLDSSMDQVVPRYERLSFGPGQRYASKGCYVVQLSQGEKPELVKKSPWVIP